MDVDLTIKNYRCFPDSHPAKISIRRGFTAFIGVNNSGKSSLLKFFYEFRHLFGRLADPSSLQNALTQTQAFEMQKVILDTAELFHNGNDRDMQVMMRFPEAGTLDKPLLACVTITILRNTNTFRVAFTVGAREWDNSVITIDGNHLFLRKDPPIQQQVPIDLSAFYKICQQLTQVLYIGPFRNAINVGTNEDYFDIQIGQAFVKAWKTFKMGNIKQRNEAAYRLTNDIKRIFDFDDLQIDPAEGDTTLQVLVNGKSYKLPEVGSGITQFILVLANAAIKRPSWILIDEPESNLHPSLQLDFLTTLASYADQGIMFATHSIGLARAGAERVYTVQKIKQGESRVDEFETIPRLSEFLGELSFAGYQDVGFERVLLVEGSTEVKTFQQFLRQHGKDHTVVLLPLGGNDLIKESSEAELLEIKRITENVSAIIDSERTSPNEPLGNARKSFVEVCGRVGIKCCVLERRATENYLSDVAIKRVKGEKYRALGPFEKIADTAMAWSKSENWRIAREMTKDDLQGTDLGKFFEKL